MSKIECRIIKTTLPNGREYYTIEQKKKRFFGGYKWKEVSIWDGWIRTTYDTLYEAEENLCWWNGTRTKTEVVSTPFTISSRALSKQTAVEWLAEKYILVGMLTTPMVERAKAMEREQIIEAHKQGQEFALLMNMPDSKEYYNQTYKGGEQ